MRFLLTGHRGFIGSVVHRLMPEARALESKNAGVDELAEALRGVDCLVHLAGGGGPKRCQEHPREAMENNVLLTYRLVQAARRAGVQRMVFSSSIAVYGTAQCPPNPISEAQPASPDDLYGSLKWACEEMVREMPHAILRFASVYGLGTGVHLDRGGFLNNVCRSVRSTGRIVLSSATQGVDFVHVSDAARAVALCARNPSVQGVYNIGGGRATSLVECATLIKDRLETPVTVVVDEKPGYATRFLDISRARGELGWQPTVSLADGIEELLTRS